MYACMYVYVYECGKGACTCVSVPLDVVDVLTSKQYVSFTVGVAAGIVEGACLMFHSSTTASKSGAELLFIFLFHRLGQVKRYTGQRDALLLPLHLTFLLRPEMRTQTNKGTYIDSLTFLFVNK